jgi:hypothetical protein
VSDWFVFARFYHTGGKTDHFYRQYDDKAIGVAHRPPFGDGSLEALFVVGHALSSVVSSKRVVFLVSLVILVVAVC